MTFALRAFWVLSPNEELPIFQRIFPTVELRAQKLENYQPLPEQKEFVNAVLIEIGIKHSDAFVLSRDRCDKKCMAPAFQISTSESDLEPVVILQHRGLLLCALPLVEDPEGSVLEVAQTLDCLNTIADRLSGDLSQRNDLKMQLTKLMVVNFPFGRPQTENAVLTEHIIEATLKQAPQDKIKVPTWNPNPNSKSKNVFAFHVVEQIHCLEKDAFATGVISVTTSETSEIQPEVTVTISHPNPLENISLSPRAQIENASAAITTIKFNPNVGVKMDLVHYSISCQNPIDCVIEEGLGLASQKLIVRPSRASLQRLEVKIHTKGKFKFSVGTACEIDGYVKWDVPVSKFKAKTAEIEIMSPSEIGKPLRKLEAEACYKLSTDSCWSGLKILTNSLSVNGKTAKIKCSAVSETVSGNFRI